MWLFLSISQLPIGQFVTEVAWKGQKLSDRAAKQAWAEPKHSLLCKPCNLTTINCELQWGQGLSCPCVRDMSLLVSYDTFHQLHKTTVVFCSASFLSRRAFPGSALGWALLLARKAASRIWPLCTKTGQWQCDLHYSNSSLHRAVISVPGKLMSLHCRSRLGAAASLPGRGEPRWEVNILAHCCKTGTGTARSWWSICLHEFCTCVVVWAFLCLQHCLTVVPGLCANQGLIWPLLFRVVVWQFLISTGHYLEQEGWGCSSFSPLLI